MNLNYKWFAIVAFFYLCQLPDPCKAQADSNNLFRASLLFQGGGPEILGVGQNLLLGRHFSVNWGIGINLDWHIGMNGYLIDRTKSRTAVYAGWQFISLKEASFDSNDDGAKQVGIYFPIGVEYMAPRGFTFQVEFGPNFVKHDWDDQGNTGPFLFTLRIGKTFGMGEDKGSFFDAVEKMSNSGIKNED